jgi:8-oxo-dGTP diphosphatase
METELATFLARHEHLTEEEVVWGGGSIRLQIRCYLGIAIPPLKYVTSVRSIVFKRDCVLVLRNLDDTHIYPGGRREANESLDETLRREVLEETGWEIGEVTPLGFIHFHHLAPMPPYYPYPHPDFMQVVYIADALRFVPGARSEDDYEVEAGFRPVSEVAAMSLSPGQHLFLKAALQAREMP